MQEEARRQAAEEMARARRGWLGNLRWSFSQSFTTTGGSYDGEPRACGVDDRSKVGCRVRQRHWNDAVASVPLGERGATIPPDLAMVLSSESEADFSAAEW